MAEKKPSPVVDTIVDFAIILAISFLIFFGLTSFGAPLWLALVFVGIWGAFTGYRPKFVRKIFPFLYKEE